MRHKRRTFIVFLTILVVVMCAIALWLSGRLNQDLPVLDQIAGELVFMSDRDGDWDIYRLDAVGELHNLTTESDGHDYYPFFTFDGEHIGMFSATNSGVTPARVDVNGSGYETQRVFDAMLTVLADGQTDWDPVWSPGGDRVAWTKLVLGLPPQVDLFVADVNGDNRIQLTDDAALDGIHAWSPDGTQLIYESDADGGLNNTYVVTIADRQITRLTDHAIDDYAPFWSTDGSRILVIFSFAKQERDGVLEMHVMDADGGDLRPLDADEVFTGDLTTAPDGETVAYVSNESGYWHIYLMDADGSNVRQITDGDSNNLYPAWRPVPAE